LLVLGGLVASAGADATIEELLVRRKGTDVNIRVMVRNPAVTVQKGPVVIELYVRDTASNAWEKINTWNDIKQIKAGEKVSRDFFQANNAKLRALAADGAFEARAVVKMPGGVKDMESVYSWKDKP